MLDKNTLIGFSLILALLVGWAYFLKPSDEEIRKTRMDVLNMFYDTFDDDVISITSRPQNLYIIP